MIPIKIKVRNRAEKMKKLVWNIPPVRPIPEELLRAGYSPLLSSILVARGITTAAGAGEYLACGPEALNDPFALAGMEAAVRRIRTAQQRHDFLDKWVKEVRFK